MDTSGLMWRTEDNLGELTPLPCDWWESESPEEMCSVDMNIAMSNNTSDLREWQDPPLVLVGI